MKRIILSAVTCIIFFNIHAQTIATSKPKLVIGIVIDQMRWDYLYRFNDLYKPTGGFKRLMNNGFNCENTFVPYLPTVTACGHACIYTGSVPAIHGITGNNWWDNNLGKKVYCVDDKSVQTVGSAVSEDGQMSPKNLWATTVTDELRLATNFRSKVIGISMKDRGSIIPAGHAANAAYWYDGKSGNFITSTYYMQTMPAYVQAFNDRKMVDSFYQKNWNILLNKAVYEKYCDTDSTLYEKNENLGKSTFPYNLQQYISKKYTKIRYTPYGNNLLAELAKTIIVNEQMGKHDVTDFLAISFSSTDFVGHEFGPNSWEILDTYVRLDETLGNLLDYLNKTVGKNEYTIFLTADHAGAHIPEFLNKHSMAGSRWHDADIKKEMNEFIVKQFGSIKIIDTIMEHDIYLNHKTIDSLKLNIETIKQSITQYLLKKEMVLQVIDKLNIANAPLPQKIREMIFNGYNTTRSGDLQIIMKSGIMDATKMGISHSVWSPDDSHIPLLWYGWGIKHGSTHREILMTDIAATISALLNIQMPNGCIGHVITEIIQ